jgi:hypothetical protein
MLILIVFVANVVIRYSSFKVTYNYVVDVIEWCATDEARVVIQDLILVGELNKNYSAKDLLKIYKK